MMEKGSKGGLLGAAVYVIGVLALTLSLTFLISSLSLGISLHDVFRLFISSSVGSLDSVLRTLTRATPMLISTLGLLIAFRSGVWNIGGEGQIVIGVVVTTGVSLFLGLPPSLSIPLSLVASFFIAGAYGALAGFLKSRWDVNEVVVTMMQNFIAFALLQYLINGPWNWGVGLYPRTEMIPVGARLPFIMYPLNIMFLFALIFAGVAHLILERTVLGYELRAMGSDKRVAFIHGVDVKRLTVLSMLISGGVCGLAGSGLVLGYFFRAQAQISGNYGFYSIASAFIANNRAAWAPLSSLLIAFIYEGTLGLTALGIPHRLCEAIVGIVFIVVLLPKELGWLRREE
jgi:simple sugar transport system permease protein